MQEFFSTNHAKSVLSRFKSIIRGVTPKNDFDKQRNALVSLVVGNMESNPEEWDSFCSINIGWIGDQFINRLSEDDVEKSKHGLDNICSMCFRFLFEYYLSIKNDFTREFEVARQFVFNNLEHFDADARGQIEYAIRDMPISIFKQLANSAEIKSLKDFNELSKNAISLKEKWDGEINEKQRKVNELKNALDKYEKAFNFVGLYEGFDELTSEKNTEKNNILLWLKFLSVIIVLPLIFEIVFIFWNVDKLLAYREAILFSIFPMVSFVAIAIYYFRVLLVNYKSVKAQLLQIELRKTLCRFIQDYAGYSSEIKKHDSSSLEKFESLIFSGIVTHEDSMPSTYDGIEQLGKLIKSARS